MRVTGVGVGCKEVDCWCRKLSQSNASLCWRCRWTAIRTAWKPGQL